MYFFVSRPGQGMFYNEIETRLVNYFIPTKKWVESIFIDMQGSPK